MMATAQAQTAVIGIFDSHIAAADAVHALERAGFTEEEIGYILRDDKGNRVCIPNENTGTVNQRSVAGGALEGGMIGGVLGAAIGALIPGIGPFLVGGVLASFFGGAIAGTAVGGVLGALSALGVSAEEAEFYEQQLHAGRALVAVKAGDRAAEAWQMLHDKGGHQVHSEPQMPAETTNTFVP